jgi:hypothetical protein
MPDSPPARARWWLSGIARAATSTVVSFLAILVGLLAADNHPTVAVWAVGAAAALAAGVLSFFQARGADRERIHLQDQVADLQLRLTSPSVELIEPSEGSGSQVPAMSIRGRVSIEGFPANEIGPMLKERKLEIVPFVRPMTTTHEPAKKWWSQNIAIIDEVNGGFSGSVRLGSLEYGTGEQYQIKLAILPMGYTPKTDTTFDQLPASVPLSNTRTVYRLS